MAWVTNMRCVKTFLEIGNYPDREFHLYLFHALHFYWVKIIASTKEALQSFFLHLDLLCILPCNTSVVLTHMFLLKCIILFVMLLLNCTKSCCPVQGRDLVNFLEQDRYSVHRFVLLYKQQTHNKKLLDSMDLICLYLASLWPDTRTWITRA